MMEQDAAPAGGRRTRLPTHPGRARCPARRPLRAASRAPAEGYGRYGLPADGVPESAARRSKFRLRLWAKRNEDDRK
jgi:hypothetical protein